MSGTRGGSNDATLPLIATDTVAGEAYQRVKLDVGATGASVPVEGALPVSATDLDIRALNKDSDVVQIASLCTDLEGTILQLDCDAHGWLKVLVQPGPDPLEIGTSLGHDNGSTIYNRMVFPVGGGYAETGVPSPVTAGHTVSAYFDLNGYQHVKTDRGPVCATGARTSVAASASSVTVLASNADRQGATVFNDSTVALYLDLSGGTATTSSFTVKIAADGYYEVPFGYTGPITGVWASATGNARVTEMTA